MSSLWLLYIMCCSRRFYPIAPNNSRILKQDVVLSGYNVPAGVGLFIISSHLLHHHFNVTCRQSLSCVRWWLDVFLSCFLNQTSSGLKDGAEITRKFPTLSPQCLLALDGACVSVCHEYNYVAPDESYGLDLK